MRLYRDGRRWSVAVAGMIGHATPAVTISLAAWNGMRWLPACLESIAAQTVGDYELLVLDDASTDRSGSWIAERAARDERIRLISSDQNLGYARAHNRCIRDARGETVLLLNQDAVLDSGFLEAALGALTDHPEVGSVQGRILRLGSDGRRTDIVDTTGLRMGRDRRVVSRDQLRAAAELDRPAGSVWGVDGPAPVFRRTALESAHLPRYGGDWEVLDEDFYMQKEDVDLAWRLRRLGWEAWYEPGAVAWHVRGGADSGAVGLRAGIRANMSNPIDARVLAWRNQRLMQLKNDDLHDVARDLPQIARREWQMWLWMLLVDQRRLRAIPELFRLAPRALRKRRALAAAIERRRAT